MALVCIDRKEPELSVVVHTELLSKDKNETPEIADKPRVNRVISLISCYEDFWHDWDQTLQWEFLKMGKKLVLINVENLKVSEAGILLDHLVSDAQSLVVSVTYTSFDVL